MNGKVVLITGANRGIGKVILEESLRRGASKVYAAVRNLDSADSLIEAHGERVVAVLVDLNDPDSIVAASKTASDVDVVVNNAGVMHTSDPLDVDAMDNLLDEFNANVGGLIRIAQAFAPVLKANGGGSLVQLNSVASVKASARFATYCASKAASYSITQGLSETLREQGTHVVSVHPGPILTDMAQSAGFGDFASPPVLVAEAIFEAIENRRFHAWVGPLAQLVSQRYQTFSDKVIEGDMSVLRNEAFGIGEPKTSQDSAGALS
ncbi:SDR family oxidoreductase [Mariniblastus fucicola]|uniref:Gluconate 5-dehydrogenase n=1 Tax=Mariniblastus fucicola TaxID=980251 RepID=A0A5B9P723_9BACT|nr:SDR family oxidoreductase [Mariniblastus fucicola]QEG20386.1 Gluconate 5-dehydrogenase [Mariniblastus fucicola]